MESEEDEKGSREQFAFAILAIGDALVRKGLIDTGAPAPLSVVGMHRADQVLALLRDTVASGDGPPEGYKDIVKQIITAFGEVFEGDWNKPEIVDAIWDCIASGNVPGYH